MSTMMTIHSLLQILENTIAVPLNYVIKILQLPSLSLNPINDYINKVFKINQHHWQSLHMEREVYIF